jgi:hypothetical protein
LGTGADDETIQVETDQANAKIALIYNLVAVSWFGLNEAAW